MDLIEFAAAELKKGKKPKDVRQSLIENGYPVYEVENALATSEDKLEKPNSVGVSVKVNAPGYAIIIVLSVALLIIGIITLVFYIV